MTDPCETCPLGTAQAVASRGPVPAQVLFLSGAPRYHEEHEGLAFASPLFSWLEESLASAGLDSASIHYATLIGCRPPHQRPPRDAEIAACAPRLDVTIKACAPRVVVLCGPEVIAAVLPGATLAGTHGRLIRHDGRCYYPLRHPYTAPHSDRYLAELMADMRRLAELLRDGLPADEADGAAAAHEDAEIRAHLIHAPNGDGLGGHEGAGHEAALGEKGVADAPTLAEPAHAMPSHDQATQQENGGSATTQLAPAEVEGDASSESLEAEPDDTGATETVVEQGGDPDHAPLVSGDVDGAADDEPEPIDSPTQLSFF